MNLVPDVLFVGKTLFAGRDRNPVRKHLFELLGIVLVAAVKAFPRKGNPFPQRIDALDKLLYRILVAGFDVRIGNVPVVIEMERARAHLRKQELVDAMLPVVFPNLAAMAENVHVHDPLFPGIDIVRVNRKRRLDDRILD